MSHGGWTSDLLQCGRGALAVLLLFAATASLAQDDPPADNDEGDFRIRRADLELRDGIYYLSALASLRLSDEGQAALSSGLPLGITYELEFLNRLRLWWDTEAATLRQSYRVEFHALTERYLVTNLNTGEQTMYSDLDGALAYIGQIDNLPAIDSAVLDDDRRYEVRLRVLLDAERLPGPLRLIAFWRRDWSLNSGWTEWRLDEE